MKRNPFIYRLLARDFYTQITALCRRNVWRK
nr:MAG TPA_asm: Olfactory receptor [Caudoviricetes sp.]